MLTRKQYELLVFIDQHLTATGFSPSFEEMKEALSLKSKSGIHRLISALEERGFLRRRHHRARALEVVRLPEDRARGKAALATAGRAPEGRVAEGRVSEGRVAEGHVSEGHAAEGHAAEAAEQREAARGAAARAGEGQHFAPNVIRGDFTPRLAGVRAGGEAGAIELPLYGRIAAGLPIEAMQDAGTHIEVPLAMLGTGEHFALEVAGDSMIEAGILDGDTVVIRQSDTADNGQIVVALVDEGEVTLKRLRRRGNSIALEPANARHETRIFPADRVRVQGRLVALLRRY